MPLPPAFAHYRCSLSSRPSPQVRMVGPATRLLLLLLRDRLLCRAPLHLFTATHADTVSRASPCCLPCHLPRLAHLPAVLGVNESARLIRALRKESIPCKRIVVNQIIGPDMGEK